MHSAQAGPADTSKMYTALAASLCFIYFLDNKIFENKLNFYQNPGQSLQFSFVCSIFDKILIFIFYITVGKITYSLISKSRKFFQFEDWLSHERYSNNHDTDNTNFIEYY